MKQKKSKPIYKVYITYYTDGDFYIGFTQKEGQKLASYFGSNTIGNKLVDHKDIVFKTPNKTDAKLYELLLQLDNINNPKCVNKMLNIRLRSDHIKDLPKFKINFIK